MTQIAHARRFDGSDEIQVNALDYEGVAIGDMSWVFIVKPRIDAYIHGLISLTETDNANLWQLFIFNNAEQLAFYNGVELAQSSGDFAEAAMGWMLLAATKANGTSTIRWHKYRYDTTTWTHEDDDAPTDEGGAVGPFDVTMRLGNSAFSEFLDGDLACVAVYNSLLSDGNLESMTDDIASWEALSPTSLWLLNQDDVGDPVLDRVGNADQVAITGTSVVSISDLSFDVGGSVEKQSFFINRKRRIYR